MAEEAERFGARLRERRQELGLTQREVADRVAGKTEGKDISRYERGEHMPGQDTRTALATALETTLADLYSGPVADREEQGPAPDVMTALSANADETIARELRELRARVDEVLDRQATLLARLDAVLDAQERQQQLLERPGQTAGATGKPTRA